MLGLVVLAAGCKTTGIEVHHLKLVGVKQIPASDLQSALATQPSSKLPWGKKNYFDRAKFEADLKRIQAFYLDRGFPDARITGFDATLNQAQDKIDITIDISEGQPVVASSVAFDGFDVLPAKPLNTLEARASMKQGERMDRSSLNATRELALNALRDNGYPFAKVTIDEQKTSDAKKARVTFKATPGEKSYFGPVQVAGNKSVGEDVIRRELRYKPGDLYRRNVLLESQRKLYNLELFQFANIQNLPDAQPPEVPTRVTVAESRHQRLQFSGGYGTEEKVRAEAQWQNVNFLGGARELGVHGKWSSLDHGVRTEFNQPYFFGSSLSFGLEGHQWYDDEPAFTQVSSGGRLSVRHQINPRNWYSVAFTDEYEQSTIAEAALNDPTVRPELIALGLNPVTGKQNGTLNAITFTLARSTAPNPLNATKGHVINAHFEQAGHWVRGTFAYSAIGVEGRQYVALNRQTVLAGRLRYGTIHPSGNVASEVPFFKRVFLGGADSLRGWGRYEVSPLSASGLTIGGFTMFEGSGEIRRNLTGKLGLVGFLDFGNVWSDAWRVHLNALRYDIGPGLRYDTPVGPARVDWGYQLNPIPDLLVNGKPQTRRWRIHFSIGQAF